MKLLPSHILLTLKTHGLMIAKTDSLSSEESRKNLSIIILKNVNLDSITGMKKMYQIMLKIFRNNPLI